MSDISKLQEELEKYHESCRRKQWRLDAIGAVVAANAYGYPAEEAMHAVYVCLASKGAPKEQDVINAVIEKMEEFCDEEVDKFREGLRKQAEEDRLPESETEE